MYVLLLLKQQLKGNIMLILGNKKGCKLAKYLLWVLGKFFKG